LGNTQPQPLIEGKMFAYLNSPNKQDQASILGGVFEKKSVEEKKPVSFFD